MNPTKLIGIILIVAGGLGLAYGGFSYTKETTGMKLGPIELKVEEKETVDVPLIVSAGAIAHRRVPARRQSDANSGLRPRAAEVPGSEQAPPHPRHPFLEAERKRPAFPALQIDRLRGGEVLGEHGLHFPANSRPMITALISSLSRKLRQSRLVEPTVDQTPSMTAVLECSSAPARS